MATARPTLAAEHREVTGKAVNRLRKAGLLPAVVYGHGVDSTNLTVDAHEFDLLRKHVGPNALIDLSVDGKKADPGPHPGRPDPPGQPPPAARGPVPRPHDRGADGRRAARGDRRCRMPSIQLNGTLLHPTESVRVRALPDHLPQSIEYSVESLVDFDVASTCSDLTIPSDVTLLNDPDEIIAKVQAAADRGRGGAGRRRGRGARRRGGRGAPRVPPRARARLASRPREVPPRRADARSPSARPEPGRPRS